MGIHEQLNVDGSIVMDESAVISTTYIQNNGKDAMAVGSVNKSLTEDNWWETNNQMDSDKLNKIWVCAA